MANSKFSHIPLDMVMSVLVAYMDADNARRMADDLSPGKSYIPSCEKAYKLYEKAMNGSLQKPVIW